jgi:hypothetical protein
MNTVTLFAVRCNPTVTRKRLEAIQGTGTAYITELIRNKKGETIVSTKGYTKVKSFGELKKAAEAGKDVIYKTASLQSCAKFYVKN